MNTTRRLHLLIAFLATSALLAACGTSGGMYQEEGFAKQAPYARDYARDETQACEAAQRALLSQGYRIESIYAQNVRAIKDFQPDEDRYVTIDFAVVCMSGKGGSTVYVNAVETTYALKKISGAASLSVAGGGIALPWGKSTDQLVKVAGKTIADEQFYKRFFDALAAQLGK